MEIIRRTGYTILLGDNPCEIFEHYGVEKLHGLSYTECKQYNNTEYNTYIAGLSNVSPKDGSNFLFLNLQRCNNLLDTTLLVNHEMMHMALEIYKFDVHLREEEIITWAEDETRRLMNYLIKKLNLKV
mgnify:CR=1 FL=1